jgi:hypothetical protein
MKCVRANDEIAMRSKAVLLSWYFRDLHRTSIKKQDIPGVVL